MQADDWTPQQSQALRDQVTCGISFAKAAAAINARVGTNYTRNAAIGRGRRMGLVGSPRPTPANAMPDRRKRATVPSPCTRNRQLLRPPGLRLPAPQHIATSHLAFLSLAPPELGSPELGPPELVTPGFGTAASGAPAPGHQTGDASAPFQLRCVGISPRLVSFARDLRLPLSLWWR